MNDDEIPLRGGRVTQGVVRKGAYVYRPCCENADFTHRVLQWLEQKDPLIAPHFLGLDNDGREITTFLEGKSPDNLGEFSAVQLQTAGIVIRRLHDLLADFPNCKKGQTVCHNDLSPCNFMFKDDMPYAVFDWDSANIGNPKNDLAYAIWMWCDIGNEEQSADKAIGKIKHIVIGYGIDHFDLANKIVEEMDRVYCSVIGTDMEKNTQQWIAKCKAWVVSNSDALCKLRFK